MKRSEMIEKIELALSEIAYAESIDKKKFESDYIADRILEVCEQAGMLPPSALSGHSGEVLPWEVFSEELESCEITPQWEEE